MVDEDAGELVADRLVDQHRGDALIDAARQPADDAPLPTWARILAISAERKCAIVQSPGRPAILCTKLEISLAPSRRVHHLGVEHCRVDAALLVGRDGERRVLARRHDLEALRQLRDAVAVAHPHGVALADFPDAVEQRARLADLDLGAAELGGVAALDPAAELRRRRLLAVADAEDRQAGVEHPVAARAGLPSS